MNLPDPIFKKRTWELLYDKEVSRAVDQVITEKPQANDEVKRLVRSFLPRVPDGCCLPNNMEVAEANWCPIQEEENDDGTRHLWFDEFSGEIEEFREEGDSIWVTYHRDGSVYRDCSGIARVILLTTAVVGSKNPVKISDVIPFERFHEYFEGKGAMCSDREPLDACRFSDCIAHHRIRVWRSHDDESFVINVFPRGSELTEFKAYKQLDGTWAVSARTLHTFQRSMKVGMGFMSGECVEKALASFANRGVRIEIPII